MEKILSDLREIRDYHKARIEIIEFQPSHMHWRDELERHRRWLQSMEEAIARLADLYEL
jgi:hypothetical protein